MKTIDRRKHKTPEHLQKISQAIKARAKNPTPAMLAGRKKMRAAIQRLYDTGRLVSPMKGKAHSLEARAKLSAAMRRRVADPNYVPPTLRPGVAKKIGDAHRGRPSSWSEETRRRFGQKIREYYRTGRIVPAMWNPDSLAKVAAFHRGRPKSPEMKLKISAGVKRAYRDGRLISGWNIAAKSSKAELMLSPAMKRMGFLRHASILTGTRARWQPDFVQPEKLIVVEIDGSSHQHAAVAKRDIRKERFLQDHGYLIIHFTETYAREHIKEIVSHVRQACTSPSKPMTSAMRMYAPVSRSAEDLLWVRLQALGFTWQRSFIGPKRIRFRVDFAHDGKRLVLELDGAYHRSARQIRKDRSRDVFLRRQGWSVLRLSESEVFADPGQAIITVANALNTDV